MNKKAIKLCLLIVVAGLFVTMSIYALSKCTETLLSKDWLATTDTKIEALDDELKSLLARRYMLYITDDIIFVEGYYDHAFQDNSIHLTLKVPDSKLTGFYNEEHYEESDVSGADTGLTKCLTFDGELYTTIRFYTSDGEYTLVEFTGRYPGKR